MILLAIQNITVRSAVRLYVMMKIVQEIFYTTGNEEKQNNKKEKL